MANKKPPAKKAPAKKAAAANSLSAKEQETIADALHDIFEGRTSPNRVADNCLEIWKASTPKKKWQDEVWAPWTTGYGV